MSMLTIENLHVRVEGKEILKGLSLTVNAGEVHAIMGPNGAGKSTLGNVLSGRDGYEVTAGSVIYNGIDLLALDPEERAAAGVFLAFQYPVEIPGVNNTYFLRAAFNAQRKVRGEKELDSMQFLKLVREKLKVMQISDELLHRAVNEGFSGGEKKRNEIFQMAVLEPQLAILDETDSGLDIDALKQVAQGVNTLRSPERAFLMITHYQRLLDYVVPDFVHVLADGRIVESGDKSLALKLEAQGYAGVAERQERRHESAGNTAAGDCPAGCAAAAQRHRLAGRDAAGKPRGVCRRRLARHARGSVEVHRFARALAAPLCARRCRRTDACGRRVHAGAAGRGRSAAGVRQRRISC
jgi:Fe-S cluster assembly ATP-binding protein